MASLILGAGVLGYNKYKTSQQKKRAKKAWRDAQFAELEAETAERLKTQPLTASPTKTGTSNGTSLDLEDRISTDSQRRRQRESYDLKGADYAFHDAEAPDLFAHPHRNGTGEGEGEKTRVRPVRAASVNNPFSPARTGGMGTGEKSHTARAPDGGLLSGAVEEDRWWEEKRRRSAEEQAHGDEDRWWDARQIRAWEGGGW